MPGLRMRIRITPPRIRIRISGLANTDLIRDKQYRSKDRADKKAENINYLRALVGATRRRPLNQQSRSMKRIGNLYDKIISLENLQLADKRARKGKLKTYGVKVHDRNREANLIALHEALKNGTYRTSQYSTFTIYEPKERVIYRLPYYPDRIVHHAVMNVLEPIWLSVFTADTYSCIKKRGIHAAAKKLRRTIDKDRENCKYCLKIDIRKFYPSIKHDVLKSIIRRKIKDTRLLLLLDEIIDSTDGLPIGNYLSQYLANLVLTYFDHWVKEVKRIRYYFRYADDIVVMHSEKKYLREVLAEFETYLTDNVKLEVKSNKQIFPVGINHRDRSGRGIDFLGFVFYHNETRLRKRIKQNLCRKCANLIHRKKPMNAKDFQQAIASWWGWCKYSDSEYFVNKLNEKIKPYGINFGHSPGNNSTAG